MMNYTTLKLPGSEAIETLHARRALFAASGEYPFLIGDTTELSRINEAAAFNDQSCDNIVQGSREVDLQQWMSERRAEVDAYGFSEMEALGIWPGASTVHGEVSLHRDVLTGKIKSEVALGLAKVEEPWQLPGVLKYGGWNDCPEAEVHCAFHRKWQAEYGAQIAGMSGDVIECIVENPPPDQATAIDLAWQQYWYCADIVDQGCGTVNKLAATLLDSPYWYFWWD